MGTHKQSEASKKQWAAISPEERKKRMKKMHAKRDEYWGSLSPRKKKALAKKAAKARWGKKEVMPKNTA